MENSSERKKQKRREKEQRPAAKWLLSLIGEDWGIRVLPSDADKPRPVHANRNKRFEAVISKGAWRKPSAPIAGIEEMLGDFQEPAPGRSSGIWLDRLSQSLILRHFEGVPREFRIKGKVVVKPETVYFTGRRARKGETCLTLLMIDIDAHKVGNLKNAMQFANHLRDNFLPNCYIEVSTNGNGAHIFLIVDKTGWEDTQYNAVLKELDAWLKGVLAETGIVLDDVEIKGTCALVAWKDGMPDHTAGLLAKLPREWERFDELKASPTYTAHQLLAMPKFASDRSCPCAEGTEDATGRERVVPGCRPGEDRTLAGLSPSASSLRTIHVGKNVNNRLVVTSEDVGICCALLEFIGKHMNDDGTLPWARTKGL